MRHCDSIFAPEERTILLSLRDGTKRTARFLLQVIHPGQKEIPRSFLSATSLSPEATKEGIGKKECSIHPLLVCHDYYTMDM